MLTMINIATILSVKDWAVNAEYGLASVSYIVLAVLIFFIPAALVSAEMATGWPCKGGVFAWVKEGLGHRMGFLAIWLLWLQNIVWYPTILSFTAAAIAYIVMPELSHNPLFIFSMIFLIFWGLTFINLKGMQTSSWISTIGVIFGLFLPGTVIILFGFAWVSAGNTVGIDFTLAKFLPKASHIPDLAFLAGTVLSLCGIEMSAVHVKDVIEPQKNYPKAIFFSATIISLLTILGTIAIAITIPKEKISLIAGSMEAIDLFLKTFRMEWLVPTIAILVAMGAIGTVSTWIAGPCRGLLAAAEKGDFPPLLQKTNKRGMPHILLIIQGCVVTILATAFVFMQNTQSSFWILTALAAVLYALMYVLMFISAIRLRYLHPRMAREYRVPGGKNWGMWVACLLGLFGSLFVIIIAFIPPPGLGLQSSLQFNLLLGGGIALSCGIPILLYEFRPDSWKRKPEAS